LRCVEKSRKASRIQKAIMSASCCNHADDPHRGNQAYRRVLGAVLAINAVMFAVEVAAGVAAGSASLQADALDFLGDAGNYAISLFSSWHGTSLSSHGRFPQRSDHERVRRVGPRGNGVACLACNLAQCSDDGFGGHRSPHRQCCVFWSVVGLPWRRCEYALSVGLHAQ
jgi:hypothetical protein